MSVLLTLALASLGLLSPQGSAPAAGQDPAPGAKAALLAPAEQEGLRTKLIKYLDAEERWQGASGLKNREKASKAREKAKDEFEKDWAKLEKKGDLLGSMARSRNARRLLSVLSLAADVAACLAVDVTDTIARLAGDRLVADH